MSEEESKYQTQTVEASLVDDEQELALRATPLTIESLSVLGRDRALEIIDTREMALVRARAASIALTFPADWTLFRRGEDQGGVITAFLGDVGCQRIEDLWQIEVTPCGDGKNFQCDRIDAGEEFAYIHYGDGYCGLTKRHIVGARGVSRSDENYVKDKHPIQKAVEVQSTSFTRLHGNIVRRFTGLNAVEVAALDYVWKLAKQDKSSAGCALGKGFGTRDERLGAAKSEYGEAPFCPACDKAGKKVRMILRPGKDGRPPFWGCPNYKTCQQKPIDAKAQKATTQARQKADDALQQAADREPGEESPAEQETLATVPERKNQLLDALKEKRFSERRKEFTRWILEASTLDQLRDIEASMQEVQS